MPLFFFLSGLVFSNKDRFDKFLLKRVRSIYIPFLFFMIIDYLVFIFQHNGVCAYFEMGVEFLKQILGMQMFNEPYRWNGPLWFLCALFFSEIVFYFVSKLNKILIGIIGAICIVGIYFLNFEMPFAISHIVSATIFLSIGFLSKDILVEYVPKLKSYHLITISVLGFAIVSVTASLNSFVHLRGLEYGNIFWFMFNALMGIVATMSLSVLLRKVQPLNYFGKNSIVILCIHLYLTRMFFPYIFSVIGIDNSYLHNVSVQMVILVLILGISYFAIEISNRYLWFIFGRKRRVSNKKQITEQ